MAITSGEEDSQGQPGFEEGPWLPLCLLYGSSIQAVDQELPHRAGCVVNPSFLTLTSSFYYQGFHRRDTEGFFQKTDGVLK